MLFHGNETRWIVGDSRFQKVFGPSHQFLKGCSPKDTQFLVKSVFPSNRDSEIRVYDTLAAKSLQTEIDGYLNDFLEANVASGELTRERAREFKEEDDAIPKQYKVLFFFIDESGKATSALRLLDYSPLPGTYGGDRRTIVTDAEFRLAHQFLGIALGHEIPRGLVPLSAAITNLQEFSFEAKLKEKKIPERGLSFPVPLYRLSRYWIKHDTLESPEPLLRRVAEYLYFKEGFAGKIPEGTIYAETGRSRAKLYTSKHKQLNYHFEGVYDPSDFNYGPDEDPPYVIRQSATEFFRRHAGFTGITYSEYPSLEVLTAGAPTSSVSP